MVVLDSWDTTSSACFKGLRRHSAILQELGVPVARAYLVCARFKFGGSRLGGVQFGADVPAGIARRRGTRTAFLAQADIPTLLREGAFVSSEGESYFFAVGRDGRTGSVGRQCCGPPCFGRGLF